MDRRLLTRTTPLALALVLALGATLTGCGSDEPDPNTPTGEALERTPTPTPTPTPTESEPTEDAINTITIVRENDKFDPSGEKVKVPVGEEILIVVVSDVAGELHVHSTPEQEISYKKGTSQHRLTIDIPGVVEVESHDPDYVIVQLQAS